MALHLIKLAVGVDDLAHMKKVQAARRKQRRQGPRSPHWVYTRNTPRRAEELLHGGSLYWVVRGVIRCRQELVGFEEDFDKERRTNTAESRSSARSCRPRRGPAGPSRAGATSRPTRAARLSKGDTADMPTEMAAELKRLGLLSVFACREPGLLIGWSA